MVFSRQKEQRDICFNYGAYCKWVDREIQQLEDKVSLLRYHKVYTKHKDHQKDNLFGFAYITVEQLKYGDDFVVIDDVNGKIYDEKFHHCILDTSGSLQYAFCESGTLIELRDEFYVFKRITDISIEGYTQMDDISGIPIGSNVVIVDVHDGDIERCSGILHSINDTKMEVHSCELSEKSSLNYKEFDLTDCYMLVFVKNKEIILEN